MVRGISAPDLSNYVEKSSDGNLDMNGRRITNLADPTGLTDAVSAGAVHRAFSQNFDALKDEVVMIDGSKKMTGHLDLGGKRIQNLSLPRNSTDAANRDYVDIRVGQMTNRIKPIISVTAEERGSLVGGEFELQQRRQRP